MATSTRSRSRPASKDISQMSSMMKRASVPAHGNAAKLPLNNVVNVQYQSSTDSRFGFKPTTVLRENALQHPANKKQKSTSQVEIVEIPKHLPALAEEITSPQYIAEVEQLLRTKTTAGKFDFRERDAQQKQMITTLKEILRSLVEKHEQLTKGASALEDRLIDMIRKISLQLREANNNEAQLTDALATANSKLSNIESVKQKLEKDSNSVITERMRLDYELQAKNDRIVQLQRERDVILEADEQERTRLQQMVSDLKRDVDSLATERLKLDYDLQARSSQIEQLIKERDALTLSEQKAVNTLTELQSRTASLNNESAQFESQMHMLQAERNSLERELKSVHSQLQAKSQELSSALTTFARSQEIGEQTMSALRRDKDMLEQKCDTMHAAKLTQDSQIMQIQEELSRTRIELSRMSEEILRVRELEQQARQQRDEEAGRFKLQEEMLRNQMTSMQTELTAQINELKKINNELKTKGESSAEQAQTLQAELQNFQQHAGVSDAKQLQQLVKLSVETEQLRAQLADKGQMTNNLQDALNQINELQKKVLIGEQQRRQLHNLVQELKGNVRVLVRARPLMNNDGENESSALEMQSDGKHLRIEVGSDIKTFSFENIFGSNSSQKDIFDEVSQLVQSALDGYHVCLFSYGQTGSGKTYTMQGATHGEQRGIIPRSVELILVQATQMRAEGWEFALEASFLEIYNEMVRDLLSQDSEGKNLDIKKVNDGTFVSGLTRVPITSQEDVATLVSFAQRQRATAKTEMNERSSRSHSVFTLYLVGTNREAGSRISSALNLCDLAGSERLSRTGTQNDLVRLKETQAINKSLSSLADVFMAIGKRQKHIPFRNSQLTHLLEPCFSGNGKTLMIVNISPTTASAPESLCSLRFASQVAQCELGRPKRQRSSLEDDETQQLPPHSVSNGRTQVSRPQSAQPAGSRASVRHTASSAAVRNLLATARKT